MEDGIRREFSPEEAECQNRLFQEGMALIKDEILLDGRRLPRPPTERARQKLDRAVVCFQEALKINEESWSSMWALGKIAQRLGDTEQALDWFLRALLLEPEQVDIAREGGIVACEIGNAELALRFCTAAVEAAPEDPGLVANLALAHLIAGDLPAAQEAAEAAVRCAPRDKTSQAVLAVVREVADGRRRQPRTTRDIVL